LPQGRSAPSDALDLAVVPEILQHMPDHVYADSWALTLQVRNTEGACRSFNGTLDESPLFPAGGCSLANSPFELLVSVDQRIEQVIDVGPGLVFAFVPPL